MDLLKFFDEIIKAADSFGYKKDENGQLRDCIHGGDGNKLIRTCKDTDNNFWFGFIREDQPTSGAYEGLSFVIMPENKGKHCLVSIGIGSSNIGPDKELAASLSFRRSFMALTGNEDEKKEDPAKFYFKLRFDEMETPIVELKNDIANGDYDAPMKCTVNEYNEERDAPGLLPASMIVNYEDDLYLIKSWLAQYASWRNWDRYKNGNIIQNKHKAIKEAIDNGKTPYKCPNENEVKNILFEKRFVVLQGAPGCGKTWTAKKLAEMEDFKGRCEFIQFHAETTYADFVYGIRPVLNGQNVAYKGEKGALLRILDRALEDKNKDNKYLLIIDEINRANLANVLGPIFFLFEQDSDEEGNLILNLGEICDDKGEEHKLNYTHIPKNLFVVATMNTADKSLAVVDFALRRRFAWVTLKPHKLSEKEFPNFDDYLFDKINNIFQEHATDEELNLQPGQSYFMDKNKRIDSIKYGLAPLMKEYFAEGFLQSGKEEISNLFYTEAGIIMYE